MSEKHPRFGPDQEVIAGWYFVGALCSLGIDPVSRLDQAEELAGQKGPVA